MASPGIKMMCDLKSRSAILYSYSRVPMPMVKSVMILYLSFVPPTVNLCVLRLHLALYLTTFKR